MASLGRPSNASIRARPTSAARSVDADRSAAAIARPGRGGIARQPGVLTEGIVVEPLLGRVHRGRRGGRGSCEGKGPIGSPVADASRARRMSSHGPR